MISSKRAGTDGIHLFPAANKESSRAVNQVAFLLLMLNFLMAGCTAMQPMADNAASLRIELRSGEAVKRGDKVRVVTRDGLSRYLIITTVDHNTLTGHPEGVNTANATVRIPIDDIVFMEGERVSIGKTAAYTSGLTVGTVLLFGITFIIAFIVTF